MKKKIAVILLQKVIASRETVKVTNTIKAAEYENIVLESDKISLLLRKQVRGKFKKNEEVEIRIIRDIPDEPKSASI